MSYNNCFLLTGVAKDAKTQKKIKKAMFIKDNKVKTLFKWDPRKNEIIEENLQYYQMEYTQAKKMLDDYIKNGKRTSGDSSLRIGIWMEDAKWDDLYLLCIDFDKIDGQLKETPFFLQCKELADFYTMSQSGGVHCWFGVKREAAESLFDEINLTTHKHTKSFVCSINLTSNGADKFDVFCCNGRIIYEYNEWNPNRGLTDKTVLLYELFKEYVQIAKKPDINFWQDAEGREIVLEGLPEKEMKELMTDKQKIIFELLKVQDSGCKRNEWFFMGCNIKEVWGEELGGSVWLWWSKLGENYQPAACVNTWGEICRRKTFLRNPAWEDILEVNAFDIKKKKTKVHEFKIKGAISQEERDFYERRNMEQIQNASWSWITNDSLYTRTEGDS